jgi:two-component system response regulator (stage 0 sporulation protein F)
MARILVIDDDEKIRNLLRQVLEQAEYEVAEASNGREGMKCYQNNPAELVIIDLFMPEKEGLRAIVELRDDYPDAKIIAISGGGKLGRTGLLSVMEDFGVRRTFEKPFSLNEMLNAVKELLEK